MQDSFFAKKFDFESQNPFKIYDLKFASPELQNQFSIANHKTSSPILESWNFFRHRTMIRPLDYNKCKLSANFTKKEPSIEEEVS